MSNNKPTTEQLEATFQSFCPQNPDKHMALCYKIPRTVGPLCLLPIKQAVQVTVTQMLVS